MMRTCDDCDARFGDCCLAYGDIPCTEIVDDPSTQRCRHWEPDGVEPTPEELEEGESEEVVTKKEIGDEDETEGP